MLSEIHSSSCLVARVLALVLVHMLNPVFYHRLMLSVFVCIEQSCWCSLANTMKCLTGSSCFYWFHSADDRHRNITFYFSNFRTCSAPEKEVGRWIRKETRNEIKTSTPSEWSYQGGFILSLIYSWDPISDSRAGLVAAISFLIASLFVNVLKLLAMTCLILLYTKIYIWKINLTQNLYEIYWRSYIFTEKWDGEGFFETTRSSRRATGTSTKVAGELDVL